jgi:hypothetical protein
MDAIIRAVAFEANHYFRPLDWQLRLARRIVARGFPQPRHRDHAALSTAVRFVRAESQSLKVSNEARADSLLRPACRLAISRLKMRSAADLPPGGWPYKF